MTILATSAVRGQPPQTPSLHDRFLARIMPAVERHARVYFRGLRCPHRKEEAIAEAVALAWRWCVRLAQRGKDPSAFPSAIAGFAARAVRSGRRICGQEKAKDVLSPRAQQMHNFTVTKLPDYSTLTGNPLAEALMENTETPVPEQVAFRLDFPAWLATLTDRDRRLSTKLALGEKGGQVARAFGLSPGRVSQIRRELHDDWERFTCDPEMSNPSKTVAI